MTPALVLIATFILAAAAVAMTLRNLIHSALLLVAAWAGIAGFYLWAGAEFVAFAQALVYIGAVSMVVLFAVLLTRPTARTERTPSDFRRTVVAFVAGNGIAALLIGAVMTTPIAVRQAGAPAISVRELGTALMGTHAAALLVVGILLTVALLGAIVIASGARDLEEGP